MENIDRNLRHSYRTHYSNSFCNHKNCASNITRGWKVGQMHFTNYSLANQFHVTWENRLSLNVSVLISQGKKMKRLRVYDLPVATGEHVRNTAVRCKALYNAVTS